MRFRTYGPEPGITEDYEKLRAFLVKRADPGYTFGRWDWMITHSYLDAGALKRIGLWEEGGEIVAAALFDCRPGATYCLQLPGIPDIRAEMLAYAEKALPGADGHFRLMIREEDKALMSVAAASGYIATPAREPEAVFEIGETPTEYALPEGFRITSLAETFDLYKYGEALWYGFGNDKKGGPFAPTPEMAERCEKEMLRKNVNLDLKIAVVAPDGRFAAYCGMWYDEESEFALVEPVATQPDFRKLGCGRAAVLEAVSRCGALGAKRAYVGSDQQFYYSIGFRPNGASVEWKKR